MTNRGLAQQPRTLRKAQDQIHSCHQALCNPVPRRTGVSPPPGQIPGPCREAGTFSGHQTARPSTGAYIHHQITAFPELVQPARNPGSPEPLRCGAAGDEGRGRTSCCQGPARLPAPLQAAGIPSRGWRPCWPPEVIGPPGPRETNVGSPGPAPGHAWFGLGPAVEPGGPDRRLLDSGLGAQQPWEPAESGGLRLGRGVVSVLGVPGQARLRPAPVMQLLNRCLAPQGRKFCNEPNLLSLAAETKEGNRAATVTPG